MSTTQQRLRGVVKWFNSKKGYGFLTGDDGRDTFVHYTDIDEKGYRNLNEGDVVEFTPVTGNKGTKAENVSVLERAGAHQG